METRGLTRWEQLGSDVTYMNFRLERVNVVLIFELVQTYNG
jgi:hypothetical protein